MLKRKLSAKILAIIAMFAAVGYLLRFLEVPAPFSPSWLKIDLSVVPALLGSFIYGPVAGLIIDGVKEVLHILTSNSGGVGELANFMIEAALIVPAGLFYRKGKFKYHTAVGCAIGCVLMGGMGALMNYFVLFPLYSRFMPLPAIIAAYQTLFPFVATAWQAVLIHALPFNIIKGALISGVALLLLKPLAPILTKKAANA